nr:uncharacterized protein LOC123284319 isoform X1 [Equus asinus]
MTLQADALGSSNRFWMHLEFHTSPVSELRTEPHPQIRGAGGQTAASLPLSCERCQWPSPPGTVLQEPQRPHPSPDGHSGAPTLIPGTGLAPVTPLHVTPFTGVGEAASPGPSMVLDPVCRVWAAGAIAAGTGGCRLSNVLTGTWSTFLMPKASSSSLQLFGPPGAPVDSQPFLSQHSLFPGPALLPVLAFVISKGHTAARFPASWSSLLLQPSGKWIICPPRVLWSAKDSPTPCRNCVGFKQGHCIHFWGEFCVFVTHPLSQKLRCSAFMATPGMLTCEGCVRIFSTAASQPVFSEASS